jgi:hypothetical protein
MSTKPTSIVSYDTLLTKLMLDRYQAPYCPTSLVKINAILDAKLS